MLFFVLFHTLSHSCRFLLENGADKSILTEDGERPLDLVEPSDLATIRVMLSDVSGNNDNQSDDDLEQDVTGWRFNLTSFENVLLLIVLYFQI